MYIFYIILCVHTYTYLQVGDGAGVVGVFIPQCLNVFAQVSLSVLDLVQGLSLSGQLTLQSSLLLTRLVQPPLQLQARLAEVINVGQQLMSLSMQSSDNRYMYIHTLVSLKLTAL